MSPRNKKPNRFTWEPDDVEVLPPATPDEDDESEPDEDGDED